MIRFFHLLTGLLLCTASALSAQPVTDRYDDSMQVQLRHTLSDSVKARLFLYLADHWEISSERRVRHYLDEVKRLQVKSPLLKGLYYWFEGRYHFPGDIECVQHYMLRADSMLRGCKTQVAYRTRSSAWLHYAVCLQYKGENMSFAEVMLNKAIPLAWQGKDSIMAALHYKQLGALFMNTGQYDKAKTYLRSAAWLMNQARAENYQKVFVYNWLGETYLFLNQLPDVRVVMDTLKTLLRDAPLPAVAVGYSKLEGLYLHHTGQYEKALKSFDKGISLMAPEGASDFNEFTFLKIKTLIAAERHQEARQLLDILRRQNGVMEQAATKLPIYEASALIYAGLNKPQQAYEYQRSYTLLSDSIYRSRLLTDVNALEIQYRNAESLKEIATLKARNEQIALRDRNSRLLNWFMAITSLLLFVVALLLLLYYRNNKKLMRQKELNYRHQLKEVAQQQQLQFGQAVLQGEEQERRRVARDLHDGLGGILAGVKINLSGQVESIASGRNKEWTKIMGQLDHSVTELRRIAHNMMPVNLLKFGLRIALKDLCESLMTPATGIYFQALNIDSNLDEETQIHIYRIVQELLSNAIRHAEARHIILQCSQDGNTFLITQEDDGKGFNPDAAALGMGLSNIRNRVGFLSGRIEIDSVIHEGTIINIELYVGA